MSNNEVIDADTTVQPAQTEDELLVNRLRKVIRSGHFNKMTVELSVRFMLGKPVIRAYLDLFELARLYELAKVGVRGAPEDLVLSEACETLRNLIREFTDEAEVAEKLRIAREATAAREAQEHEARDRATYERLKAKFEPNS